MRTRAVLVAVAVLAAAGLGGGLAWAFTHRGPGAANTASPSVRSLLVSPQRYYGRRVVVTGSVSTVYNRHAVTLGTPLAPGLLVTAKGLPLLKTAKLNAVVRVTGVARPFSVAQWQAWTGGSSDLATLATYEGKPVVRAERVERVGPTAVTTAGGGARPKATTQP